MGTNCVQYTLVQSVEEKSVKPRLPVVVSHTVDLVVDIDGEGNAIQTLVTDATSETSRVVRLAHGL